MILTCYLLIPGFEIEETYQRIIDLQEICDGCSVSIGSRFDHKELDYPTAREVKEEDKAAFITVMCGDSSLRFFRENRKSMTDSE